MTRTQIQQLVVVLLLIAFGVIWTLSRKSSPVPRVIPVGASTPAVGPGVVASESAPSEPLQPPPEIQRDLFLLPSPLQERIRQRQEEIRRQIEEQQRVKTAPSQMPGEPPRPSAAEITSSFHLQGIFWGTPHPQAIINRQIVSVGDVIQGAKITSISKDRVLLNSGGTEAELKPPTLRTSGESHEG